MLTVGPASWGLRTVPTLSGDSSTPEPPQSVPPADDPGPGKAGGASAAVTGIGTDLLGGSRWALRTSGTTASRPARTATSTATRVVPVALRAVAGTTGVAGAVLRDPVGSTDRIVDDAIVTTRDVRDEATATAKGQLRALSIDPSLFVPEEREVVEDLIVAAIQDAQARAVEAAQAEMAKVTEGLDLPAGLKLPF